MSGAVGLLVVLSWVADPSLRSLLLGDSNDNFAGKSGLAVLSALVLYAVFWAGGAAVRTVLPSAADDIGAVFAFKRGAALVRIGLLISLIIGPGEEIFWRGFVQHRWQKRLGWPRGWLLAAGFYAAVHVATCNFILVLSALVCGLYWGILFVWFRSVVLVAVSHAVWDLMVFVLFPLG